MISDAYVCEISSVVACQGTVSEIWKNIVEKWFDPAFEEFIDRELSHVPKN